MTLIARRILAMLTTGCVWLSSTALAQETTVGYISPAQSVQKRGTAPGMKVRLISTDKATKEYVIIFSQGDEAYSGLLDFAESTT